MFFPWRKGYHLFEIQSIFLLKPRLFCIAQAAL